MRWAFKGGLLAVSGGILLGCAGHSPESRLDEVAELAPPGWAASAEARAGVDSEWVGRIAGREGERLVAEAWAGNPDLRAAGERVRRAEAVAKTAGGELNPQVSAGLGGQRTKQVFIGFPFGEGGVPSSISTNYGSQVSVSWEPDVWGFKRAGQEALIAQAEAQGQIYRAARASLAAQVVKAWLALAEANERVALAEEAVAARATTVEIVRDRFESALGESGGTATDLRLAQTQVETARAEVLRWQGVREQARRQLEILIGRYPAGRLAKIGGLPEATGVPPAGLPSGLLMRRPDILEAERRLAGAGRLLKQGKLAFFPSFSLTGSGGTTTESLRDILKSEFGVWSLAGQATQPIWAGGRLWSEYERLKADERAALADLQGVVLKAFGEVEQALVAERFLAARAGAVERALGSAREAERQAYD
ncbi:MAG: efflux transporter outer membrane subunit, partial [Verrucomicrobiales bacterium]